MHLYLLLIQCIISCRLLEIKSEIAGTLQRFLARRKAISLLDSAHCQDAVVLLVCHRPGIPKHRLRCCRALWPTMVAHSVSV